MLFKHKYLFCYYLSLRVTGVRIHSIWNHIEYRIHFRWNQCQLIRYMACLTCLFTFNLFFVTLSFFFWITPTTREKSAWIFQTLFFTWCFSGFYFNFKTFVTFRFELPKLLVAKPRHEMDMPIFFTISWHGKNINIKCLIFAITFLENISHFHFRCLVLFQR